VVLGVVAANERSLRLAERLVDELPAALGERFGDVQWRAELGELEPAELSASSRELVDAVRRCLLARGWALAVGLTELPLRVGRRPVTAHASATDGVGLVSLPALGAVGIEKRLHRAVLHLVEGLLGEASVARDRGTERRAARIAARLAELASPLGHARVHEDGTVRFFAAALRGNLRLLVGMVKANQPARVMLRLSRAVVGALGVAAYALASSNIWELADGTTWPRLIGLAMFSVLLTCGALVLAHGLWERARDPGARERVLLFNLATTATLVLAVLTLYGALLAISGLCGAALIAPGLLARRLQHAVGVPDYVRLACLVASLATIGGALGSLVESDLAVREATYRSREDERTEADG
jgi:uncharacterized membrane protein